MVNIVDAFRKLENRNPTEQELATMMQMKREMEGFKAQRHKANIEVEAKARAEGKSTFTHNGVTRLVHIPDKCEKRKRDKNGRIAQSGEYPTKMPMLARQIDRCIKKHITIEDIAYIFSVTEPYVVKVIGAWDIPRKPVDAN